MNQEKTVEELIYELGNYAMQLRGQILMSFERKFIVESYQHFKTRALKIDLELPELPQDADEQFINDQITKVKTYIDIHKRVPMLQLFDIGYTAKTLWVSLHLLLRCKRSGKNVENEDSHKSTASKSSQELIQMAEQFGVDIGNLGEELKELCNNVEGNTDFDESLIDSIGIKLEEKFCGHRNEMSNPLPQSNTVYKRSEIDPSRVITDECWTVSLARMPDRSHSQHAFIVLEGKSGKKSKIWFADFVSPHGLDPSRCLGTENGKVRLEYYESEGETNPTNRLLFKCNRELMDVKYGDHLLSTSWTITKATAGNLIKKIKSVKKNPPKFNAVGNKSVLAVSPEPSSISAHGHNCFTFAKTMLRDLNDPCIQLPEDSLETWIVSATSRYLVDKRPPRMGYATSSLLLMFGFLAGVVVAFYLPKAF